MGPVFKALNQGKVIIIDELDTSTHPLLSLKLLKLFSSSKSNQNSAQLIFTTHDTNLLCRNVLRRDQIWFIDKDQFGGSKLYPMSNFKAAADGLRNTSDFRKMYLNCHFGAAESIEISDKLISLIQW